MILDLYQHHLKVLLEANVFIYAVTGALLSFVVTHLNVRHIRLVLAFLALIQTFFAIFFWKSGEGIDYNERELHLIANGLHTNVVPRLDALKLGLKVSAAALILIVFLVASSVFLL